MCSDNEMVIQACCSSGEPSSKVLYSVLRIGYTSFIPYSKQSLYEIVDKCIFSGSLMTIDGYAKLPNETFA